MAVVPKTRIGEFSDTTDYTESSLTQSGLTFTSFDQRFSPGSTLLAGRFRVLRRVGEGGMGVVYEAVDDERRGSRVALKTLGRLDPSRLYRLKNEFRSLSEVSHPNLCRLHELFGEGQLWFFTMELVAGEHFDSWVRPARKLDEARLRAALVQLCDAVLAIHQAGKLHRDLKPENVLVTEVGRVVVLDFGLSADPELGGVGQTVADGVVSGTPAYMAPEQAEGAATTPSSDLYSLGVMLFEALTGRLPFEGHMGAVLAAKQRDEAPPVRSFSNDAPRDLADLCDALLQREPERRLDAESVRSKLGAAFRPSSGFQSLSPRAAEREVVLGRETELQALHAAYAATQRGQPVVMFVAGESGMGKSALVTHFLEDIRAAGEAAVLSGRCYERESVPFKAFDTIVDDLSRFLRRLTREEAAQLMPREVYALSRLFPVLERVEVVATAPKKDVPDLQELQQRAFAAFGELLGRVRDRRPLVLFIDDLQWACRDSTVFMVYLLALREPAPFLLIASHRSEGATENVLLQQILLSASRSPKIDCRTLSVGQLSPGAAEALAGRLLGAASPELLTSIASEAHGSPFFVGELSRQSRLSRGGASPLTLQTAILLRLESLGAGERALLNVLATAGRPLAVQLALAAAGVDNSALDALLNERLLRVTRAGGGERTLECYHDKIRECVSGALGAVELAGVHHELAAKLSAEPDTNPEHLALHFHGAGEHERATQYYERAGDMSASALAFEYAARQYEHAVALGHHSEEQKRALQVKLGSALAAAGRSREAAYVYRGAASGASPDQALEYAREAARLLMTSGYADEGRVLLGEVLSAIGLGLPRSRKAAIAAALWSRARLKLRGLGLREARGSSLDPETLRRLDALWTVVQGAIGTDPFLMIEMSAHYARLSLDSGAHGHAARALATESYLVSFDGAGTRERTLKLIAQASALAEPLAESAVSGFVQQVHGAAYVDMGSFADGRRVLALAIAWLTERCTGVAFELAAVRIYDQIAAHHLGQFAEISSTTPGLIEDALRRGDMWFTTMFATAWAVPAWLAHRGPAEARLRFAEVKQRYQPQSSYQWPDFFILFAEQSLALYEGNAPAALCVATEQWSRLEGAQLLRLQMARGSMLYSRGGCALAVVRQNTSPARAERALVHADIEALRATRVPHAPGWSAVLDAGLALHLKNEQRAATRLRFAVTCFEANGLRLYAAAARRRLGQLLGGSEGEAFVAAAEAMLATEGVLDPESVTEMLAPGCRC